MTKYWTACVAISALAVGTAVAQTPSSQPMAAPPSVTTAQPGQDASANRPQRLRKSGSSELEKGQAYTDEANRAAAKIDQTSVERTVTRTQTITPGAETVKSYRQERHVLTDGD